MSQPFGTRDPPMYQPKKSNHEASLPDTASVSVVCFITKIPHSAARLP